MNQNQQNLVIQVKKEVILPLQDKAMELMPESLSSEEKRKIMKCFYLAFDKNPELATCSRNSIAKAIMDCAETGLYPNTFHKHGDLIRYGQECQFQPQYFGLVHIARKTGQFKSISVGEIYKNDKVTACEGFENEFRIDKNFEDPGSAEPVAYWAAYVTHDGERQYRIWPRERCEKHGRKFSKAYHKAWQNSFDEMAKKTVLKNLLKLSPKTEVLAKVLDEPEIVEDVEEFPTVPKNGMSTDEIRDMMCPSQPKEDPNENPKPKKKSTRRRAKKEEPKTDPKVEDGVIVEDFIDDIEETEVLRDHLNMHKEQYPEIYQGIEKYLDNPRVKTNAKMVSKLKDLLNCWLTNDDKPLLTAAIRTGLENDFQAMDTLIKIKTRS